MKKLGLGIQKLSEFKEDNFIYVDKTEIIYKLIDDGKYYFLSRPRRFGKSLLVDTIKELFSANKALFEECWVYDKWDWDKKYPVIKLSFAEMNYRQHGLEEALELCLLQQAEVHNIQFKTPGYGARFLELIKTLGKQTPVAVLIDEYDKPIIDYLEKSEFKQALENREKTYKPDMASMHGVIWKNAIVSCLGKIVTEEDKRQPNQLYTGLAGSVPQVVRHGWRHALN